MGVCGYRQGGGAICEAFVQPVSVITDFDIFGENVEISFWVRSFLQSNLWENIILIFQAKGILHIVYKYGLSGLDIYISFACITST